MGERRDRLETTTVGRRAFVGMGVLPVAATLADHATQASAGARAAANQPARAVRIGIIGAGENVRDVMIPAFRAISECQLVAVANTSLASSQRVATQFGIPKAYPHWRALLDDREIDAVCIGTWPYMHHPLTLAALEHGKHVLCQARMANNAREAREMLAASLRHPELVCQLVPTSTSYRLDNLLGKLLDDGFLGELLSVEIQRVGRGFAAIGGELDWRHSQEFSGLNVMNAGSTYESAMRWLGRGTRVMAMAKVHVPYRRGTNGQRLSVALPDHVDVLYELAGGAQVHMRFSETTGLSSGNQTWLYGTDGTIHVDDRQVVRAGKRGETELREIPNPRDAQAVSRVEQSFVRAVRGLEPVTLNTFEIGVHYMEWTEAVHRSAATGQAVHLPLHMV